MNPWWHQPFLWIHLDNLFRQVHFEDDSDNNIVELGLDEVQPLEPERFQVGDQVMGFFEPEGTFYPCEIVEVRELTYVVHFFDSPETELYELDESQVLDQISLAEILAQAPKSGFLGRKSYYFVAVDSIIPTRGYTELVIIVICLHKIN